MAHFSWVKQILQHQVVGYIEVPMESIIQGYHYPHLLVVILPVFLVYLQLVIDKFLLFGKTNRIYNLSKEKYHMAIFYAVRQNSLTGWQQSGRPARCS